MSTTKQTLLVNFSLEVRLIAHNAPTTMPSVYCQLNHDSLEAVVWNRSAANN